jgi:hypothetical protein
MVFHIQTTSPFFIEFFPLQSSVIISVTQSMFNQEKASIDGIELPCYARDSTITGK